MFIAPNFARVTAFRYLLKSQCVQLVWSVIVAGIDFKTAVFGGPQRPPSPFRLTVTCLLDWCTSWFSLGTLCAAAAAASWLRGTPMWEEASVSFTTMVPVSLLFGLLAWCLQAFFTVIMFMYMESAFRRGPI
ncbi:unnamed protein product [Cuscuta campestris]|uniref:CASP-like protein n=1 Tax=Cuscuta campestris TaxID=132261 RepID=A0A484MP84_9ASTE|nr:unnamed protein product [Cuscuta campestris]